MAHNNIYANTIERTDPVEIEKVVNQQDTLRSVDGFILREINDELFLVIHQDKIQESVEYMMKNKINGLEINISLGFPGMDISFLSELTFLQKLSIVHPSLNETQAINSLHQLRYLALDSFFYSQLDFNNFPKLEKCYLVWTPQIKNIESAKKLKTLLLRGYKKESLEEIGFLKNLEVLSVMNSPIKSLKGLSNLLKLRILRLGLLRNLELLDGIESLQDLELLEIDKCRKITSLDSISNLVRLEEISVNDCQNIKSLTPIVNLKSLRAFFFWGDTNIVDGNLSHILTLKKLSKISFKPRKHYSHDKESLLSKIERLNHIN